MAHTSIRVALFLLITGVACAGSTVIAPDGVPANDVPVPTELKFASVLAHAPMQDTARIAAVPGGVVALGLLNQTPPCFGLTAAATKSAARVVIELSAKEVPNTCATFAAGAFDYDVSVRGLAAGTYEVDVVHRTRFRDGRVVEATVGSRRVEVR